MAGGADDDGDGHGTRTSAGHGAAVVVAPRRHRPAAAGPRLARVELDRARGDFARPRGGRVGPRDRAAAGPCAVDDQPRDCSAWRSDGLSRRRGGCGRVGRSAKRPKRCRLATDARLCAVVAASSPPIGRRSRSPRGCERVSRRPTMHVSHETIYRTLYVQARGALKKAAHRASAPPAYDASQPCGDDPRPWAGPLDRYGFDQRAAGECRGPRRPRPLGRRPARRHHRRRTSPPWWSGSRAMSCSCDCPTQDTARPWFRRWRAACSACRRAAAGSLTWDRGKEMAPIGNSRSRPTSRCTSAIRTARGNADRMRTRTACCGSTFPKGQDISHLTQRQLDAVALKLNTRPRQTLGWKTPAQVLAATVASTG